MYKYVWKHLPEVLIMELIISDHLKYWLLTKIHFLQISCKMYREKEKKRRETNLLDFKFHQVQNKLWFIYTRTTFAGTGLFIYLFGNIGI
jgi:hypothetical protein